MLKKFIVYFTLLAFLVNSAGYHIMFEIGKSYLENEMRHAIRQKKVKIDILRIAVSKSQGSFRRLDKSEFLYNGKLYDIVQEIKKGDTTIFYCAGDEKEDGLITGLKKAALGKIRDIFQDHLIKTAIIGQTGSGNQNEYRNWTFGFLHFPCSDVYTAAISPPPEF